MERKSSLFLILFTLFIAFAHQSRGQNPWSQHLLILDSLEESDPEYLRNLIQAAWLIPAYSPDSAMLLADRALALSIDQNNDSTKCRAILTQSVVHSRRGEHSQAIEKSLEALQLVESLADTISILDAYNNIGIDYYYLEDWKGAKKYFSQFYKLAEIFGNLSRMANGLGNLAIAASELGEKENEIEAYKKSIEIFKQIGERDNAANMLYNLSVAQWEGGNTVDGLKNIEKAYLIFEELNLTSAQCDALSNWGNLLFEMGRYEESAHRVNKSLKLALESKNPLQEQFAYKSLNKTYAEMGKYDSAYYYQSKYQELVNESRELEKQEYTDELLAKYEADKKEQQIANLEQENQIKDLEAERQRQWILFVLIGAALLLLAIVMLYLRYRDKNKTNAILDAKNQELARLNATKDRLFSIISHDLKSPLSSFHSITSSLYTNWDHIEKDQLKDFILSLRDSSADLKGMMNNLLKWALAQSDQLKYEPVSTNPSEVLNQVSRELRTLAELKDISVELNTIELEVEVDRDFLQIVFRNLLSNALKFSEMKSKIEVLVEESDLGKVISIRDYGVGMDQHQVEDLMGGKITAHEIQNSDQKGTGLGLVLCRELLERMNARMEVKSELGQGTTFRVVFPKAA